MNSLEGLISHLKRKGVLNRSELEKAFKTVDRSDFVPTDTLRVCYRDSPLSIGWEQTISQPYTVALMLELLNVDSGNSILDIGSGSGWTTALLSCLTGPKGKVLGLERHPELVKFGKKNLKCYSYPQAQIHLADKNLGKPGQEYDRILVSASASHFPESLLDQLKPEGILVLPVRNSLWKITHNSEGFRKEEYPGFTFVPLIF